MEVVAQVAAGDVTVDSASNATRRRHSSTSSCRRSGLDAAADLRDEVPTAGS
ncbi:hypothetical protein [Streptomyces sp. KL116D]|uniref:hypothetical protein n=1 Tax=Streptomyces sp. KL116D TaxID=3045152 RepID=UPI003558C27C